MGFLLWETRDELGEQLWIWTFFFSSEMKKVFSRSILTSSTLPGPIKVIAVKTSSCYFSSILFHFLCGPSQQKECPISSCGGWVGAIISLLPERAMETSICHSEEKRSMHQYYYCTQWWPVGPCDWIYELIWITKEWRVNAIQRLMYIIKSLMYILQ